MVSNHVSGLYQFANDVRSLLHVAADQEKCCVDIVPGQHFQQAQGVRIVGPVIVSERQLFRRPRPSPVNVRPNHCPVGAMDW